MKRYTVLFLLYVMGFLAASAQIGYQVALLNQADGTPRANETVKVDVAITNSEGHEICREEKSATTDDFGILSLAIGNSTTFETVDFTKLPFYISATVDGVLIGKSQMLNVPVAEYAKRTGVLTREFLNGKTWTYRHTETYTIGLPPEDGGGTYTYHYVDKYRFDNQKCYYQKYCNSELNVEETYNYTFDGNFILCYYFNEEMQEWRALGDEMNYIPDLNSIKVGGDFYFIEQN